MALFQELFSAPSRLLVLRALIPQPLTYRELFDAIGDGMSRPAVHAALIDLRQMGYIEDDAPEGAVRRPAKTRLIARRDLLARDFGEALAFMFS